MTPWIKIPLNDYESHMNLPEIGQASYLAETMGELARIISPQAVAVIGCAGGNGFDTLKEAGVELLIGIDINNDFCDAAFDRYGEQFEHLEIMTADFCDETCQFEQVQFLFAGLFFEYVDLEQAIQKCSEQIVSGGYFGAVIQLPCDTIAEISPSPYSESLEQLGSIMNLIDPDQFNQIAIQNGFSLLDSRIDTLESGKSFKLFLFQNV